MKKIFKVIYNVKVLRLLTSDIFLAICFLYIYVSVTVKDHTIYSILYLIFLCLVSAQFGTFD